VIKYVTTTTNILSTKPAIMACFASFLPNFSDRKSLIRKVKEYIIMAEGMIAGPTFTNLNAIMLATTKYVANAAKRKDFDL